MPDAAGSRLESSGAARAAAAAKRVSWAQMQLPVHEEEHAAMRDTPFELAAAGQAAALAEDYNNDGDDYDDDSPTVTYGAGEVCGDNAMCDSGNVYMSTPV
jgi:hypothetical protein